MKRHKVLATVVDAGQCRYYRPGRSFVLAGFTPRGICDSAYAVLSRDVQTLAYGGRLPWQKDGRVRTRCPDPDGALWELYVDDQTEIGRAGGSDQGTCSETAFWKVDVCHGRERGCRFAVTGLQPLKMQIEAALQGSGWRHFLDHRDSGPLLPHQRLKISLAACPNACTQPQIKDIGLMACLYPLRVKPGCTACGTCKNVCAEKAITVKNGTAHLNPRRCVGCGMCVKACPSKTIVAGDTAFRVLVGGRLGRRPRWAMELPVRVSAEEAAGAVERLLSRMLREARPGDSASDVTTRLRVETLTETLRSPKEI